VSKRRSQTGHDAEPPRRAAGPIERAADVDEQREIGNAALQGRVSTPGAAAASGPAPRGALALVAHGLACLHLPAADPARFERLSAIVERSDLQERDAVIDRLGASETVRALVDGALDRWFGGHDEATRWRVDAALIDVQGALAGASGAGIFGTLEQRADAGGAVGPDALDALSDAARDRAPDLAAALPGFCQSLALTVLLDEEEDEDDAIEPAFELD
jgi:hypothetical protein